MNELSEVQDLADAIDRANNSHDHESARAAAERVARVLDQEVGLETIYLRRMLTALCGAVEGREL